MYTKRFAAFAVFVGAIGICIEVFQIALYDKFLSNEWSYPTSKWNYLTFFTVTTNLLVDLWFVFVGLAVIVGARRMFDFLSRPTVMGALVVYITTVAVIYCTLLFWFIGPFSMSLWWGNLIDLWNHVLLPLCMIGTWVLAKKSKPVGYRTVAIWMIYPLIYFIGTMARGMFDGWYPYPFLRPSLVLFPFGVSISVACFMVLSFLVIKVNNRYVNRQSRRI